MTKNKQPELKRICVAGYYITEIDSHTFEVPQGLVDKFAQWDEKHVGLQKMLEGVAAFVATERGELFRQQNEFWYKITDGLGLSRGQQATIDHADRHLKIAPVEIDKIAKLRLGPVEQ